MDLCRVPAALAAALAAMVAMVLPSLAVGVDEASVAGALVAAAVVALLGPAAHAAVTVAPEGRGPAAARRAVPLVLATRPTDPSHHPLRPRAPGLV